MSIEFKADESFVRYITIYGFQRRQVNNTVKRYYSNKNGSQIKIDTTNGLISFIDKKGNTLKSSKTFSSEDVDNLIKQV